MNELSLFSGGGGGLLASRLLGWRTIGYVEKDSYCQQVIAARVKDGYLDEAPIFGDIREFVQSGASRQYRGFTDVVSGGFPCQPFSVAGKRKGEHDERNLWPETIECIRTVRPRFAFLENVPGLASTEYFARIIADLTEAGYDCRWRILSAAELGAPHKRDRLWIFCANTNRDDWRTSSMGQDARTNGGNKSGRMGTHVPHASSVRSRMEGRRQGHASGQGREPSDPSQPEVVRQGDRQTGTEGATPGGGDVPHTGRVATELENAGDVCWWEVEPEVGRMVDGMAGRVAQLRALGNGQVPAVARAAWLILTEGWEQA